MELSQISEFVTTEEISEAWDELVGYASTIHEAVNNRLEELGYDEDSEEENDEETDKLLEMREMLETVLGV